MSIDNNQAILHIQCMVTQGIARVIGMKCVHCLKGKVIPIFNYFLNIQAITIPLVAILCRAVKLTVNVKRITTSDGGNVCR